MLVEALASLSDIMPVAEYQYVGFGALEFVDFDIIHRRLGISSMVSIEADEELVPRCEANRPFNGIQVLAGRLSTHISSLDWSKPMIAWLDYTKALNVDNIRELEQFARQMLPGSVLAVTLNATPGELKERRDALRDRVGEALVPTGTTDALLGDWGLAEAQRSIVADVLGRTLKARADGATWRQFLNVFYRDRQRMQLIAAIIGSATLDRTIDGCRLSDFEFYSASDKSIKIDVPYFTPKERRILNEQLPRSPRRRLSLPGVRAADVKAYANVYRWLERAE